VLRAVIFDFDGVLVDSEPVILKLTQEMAAKEGWTVTEKDYYRDYLALDDRGIVEHLYRSHGLEVDKSRSDELVTWKAHAYGELIRDGLPPFPGAVNFARKLAERFPLAIASGSLHSEIGHLLHRLGLTEEFAVLATADDCAHSKPSPCVYITALNRLNELPIFHERPLVPAACLAIEDAPLGVEAAHAAGIRCLALAHTRPEEELKQADWVAADFDHVHFEEIEQAFRLSKSQPEGFRDLETI
jgi:HAD superfamily hydrolase (TIGR01509 family)